MTNVLSANFSYFAEEGQNKKITLAELALIKVIEKGTWIKDNVSLEDTDRMGIHHLFKTIRSSNRLFYENLGLTKGEIDAFVREDTKTLVDLLIQYMLPLIRHRLRTDELFADVLMQTNLKKVPRDTDDVVEIINFYLLELIQTQMKQALKQKATMNERWASEFIFSFLEFLQKVKMFIERKTSRTFDMKVGFVKRVLQVMFPLDKDDVIVLKVEPLPDYVSKIIGDVEIAALLWDYLNIYVANADNTPFQTSMDSDMLVSTIGNDVIARSPIVRKPTKNGFAPTITRNDKITIYTLEGCPACIDAKKLITKKDLSSTEITVTDENQNEILQKIDVETNSQRGFPIIFVNDKYIGGLDSFEKKLK